MASVKANFYKLKNFFKWPIISQWNMLDDAGSSNLVLCDNLEGDMGWKFGGCSRGRGHIYIYTHTYGWLTLLGHFLHLFWNIWHFLLLSVVLLGMRWTVLCPSLCNNMQFNFLHLLFKSHLKIWALLCNKIRNYGHFPKDKYLFYWHKIYPPTPFP